MHIKKEIQSTVVIDDVGQNVTDDTRAYIIKSLENNASKIKFMSEEK